MQNDFKLHYLVSDTSKLGILIIHSTGCRVVSIWPQVHGKIRLRLRVLCVSAI